MLKSPQIAEIREIPFCHGFPQSFPTFFRGRQVHRRTIKERCAALKVTWLGC
jgi:hypothetical protein